jgi:heme/copper-type cytochrome/quinol oxidase subunit 2
MAVSLSHRFAYASLLAVAVRVPVMHPESHYARSIVELSNWMVHISLGIFLLVTGLVAYASWGSRARPGERTCRFSSDGG